MAREGHSEVTVEGLSHTYRNGRAALDGIDLRVSAGVFGLLGPNGAGKTTTMRILSTLLVPAEGRATVAGHDVVREPVAIRRLVGYLPQEFGAWRLSRVDEALDLLASLSGVSDRNHRRERVAEVLEAVGLLDSAERKIAHLSGGMVRRLGLAQALVHRPRVLILDEPTVGLDPEERGRFHAMITELARDRTVLLSTHLVAGLEAVCGELAILDRGRIVFRGTPAELAERARGSVWEVPAEHESEVGPGFEVVSRNGGDGSGGLRGVAVDRPPSGARPVDAPTLEEAYLATLAAQGREIG